MTTTTQLDSFASGIFQQGIPMLGLVVWEAVPDLRISPADLDVIARKHGIDNPPQLGHPADAFRRATTQQSIRDGSNRFLVRPVTDDATTIVRHIIWERLDATGKALTHTHVGTMTFDKATRGMSTGMEHNALGGTGPTVAKMLTDAEALFNEYRQSLTGGEVKRAVDRYLNQLSRVTVHPNGGVYFIPAPHAEKVRQMREFVLALAPYTVDKASPCVFAVVPVPRLPEQVEQVAAGFRATITTEIEQAIGDTAEMLARTKKPSAEWIAERMGRTLEMIAKANEYKQMLGIDISTHEGRLTMLQAQVDELVRKAEGEDDLVVRVKNEIPGVVIQKSGSGEVTYCKPGRYGPTLATIRTLARGGWKIELKSVKRLDHDLLARPEVTRDGSAATVQTTDADVVMLFLKPVLEVKRVTIGSR